MKTDVQENALDLRNVKILPASGDGEETNRRRHTFEERTSCCLWKLPAGATRRRHTCKHTIVSDVANVDFIGVLASMGCGIMGRINSFPFFPVTGRTCRVLPTTECSGPIDWCNQVLN